MPNSVEYIVAYFACWELGAIAGPMNSLLKAEEIAFVISDSEAKPCWYIPDFLPTIRKHKDTCRLCERSFSLMTKRQPLENFELHRRATRRTPTSIRHRGHNYLHLRDHRKTQGCLLTHGNLIANARQISQWLGFTKEIGCLQSCRCFI